jgi:hypothetical protein
MKAFEKAYQIIEQLQHDPEQGLMEYNYELSHRGQYRYRRSSIKPFLNRVPL